MAREMVVAHGLTEPLVAVGVPTREEADRLQVALDRWARRSSVDDVSSLTSYLAASPSSPWRIALLANLGLTYQHYGYYSRALYAWLQAWRSGRNAADPAVRALVDGAIGERARMLAAVGKYEELEQLFTDIGTRPITGSATESVQAAREMLTQVTKDPRHLYNCGPKALRAVLIARGVNAGELQSLQYFNAGVKGTNLAQLATLAQQYQPKLRLIRRSAGGTVPQHALVHLKVGHFVAIVGQANGRLHVLDDGLPAGDLWMTPAALDAEATGLMLVPSDERASDWRTASAKEAAPIWGRGPSYQPQPGRPGSPPANPPRRSGCPLCDYNIAESTVALTLADTPVGYNPPIGPSTRVTISYSQREDSQPANFGFFNVGPKWSISWLSYVTDDPANTGGTVSRYMQGGGQFFYGGYDSATGRFTAQDDDGSILVLKSPVAGTYQRRLADGSIETYGRSDGSTSFPRTIFLTEVADSQGNKLTYSYDTLNRLTSLTDATGRQTTLTYGFQPIPTRVTKITDPFGRSAQLVYDDNGRLTSITDILGLTSVVGYDANSLVNTLTTPFGTTSFSFTAPGAPGPPRFLDVTDPRGNHEREEWVEPSSNPASDPVATVPVGMPLAPQNNYLQYRNSIHWDKDQYIAAGCTPTGGCDQLKGRITHFAHYGASMKSGTIESLKQPLENRVWFQYPGQPDSFHSGSYSRPLATARVLDDGTTQLSRVTYDASGYYNPTQVIDPVGRTTNFIYANGIDIQAITQKTATGDAAVVAQFTYDNRHLVLSQVDASSQLTTYAYNAAGQLTVATDPLGRKTQYGYSPTADLTQVTNANNVTAQTFTYDAFARVATSTDSEGYVVSYAYDAADRPTLVTYPDGTTERSTYDKLNLASYQDRQGRRWTYAYDANSNLTTVTNPMGQNVSFTYSPEGRTLTMSDPNTRVTAWTYDLQGRITKQTYADTSAVLSGYEATTSRLKTRTDALNQVRQLAYTIDDRVNQISYANAVNATTSVSLAYDTYFPRLKTMTEVTGVTNWQYGDAGSLGGLAVATVTGPLANSTVSYSYDAIGRVASRSVQGSGTETFGYDTLNRFTGHGSDLGAFTLSYLGQTGQLTLRALSGTTLQTALSYAPNASDRRLQAINNTGLATTAFSNFAIGSRPGTSIVSVTETSDAPTVYPVVVAAQSASYNSLNQQTVLAGQTRTYDANGNLTADGARTYAWDAENRLLSIGYVGQAGKLTAFTYDGLGRRVRIARTPTGGGTAVVTNYIWCDGARPCQARNGANAVTRTYLDEGEYVPGSPGVSSYYGIDQIGSVRRVFSGSGNPAYGYDPYGIPLDATPRVTDIGYAGMLTEADSGLSLTPYRAYDANAGRWLSRDPLGESIPEGVNLYQYAADNPVAFTDPFGLKCDPNPRWPGAGGPGGRPRGGNGGGGTGSPGPQKDNSTCRPVSSGNTVQVGLSGQGTFGIFSYQVAVGVAFDSHGNVALYGSIGPGGGVGGGGAAGLSLQGSNAPTVQDLGGAFANGSGGGGLGIGGTIDGFGGYARNGQPIVGGGITAGAAGGETSFGGVTNTFVSPSLNLLGRPTC